MGPVGLLGAAVRVTAGTVARAASSVGEGRQLVAGVAQTARGLPGLLAAAEALIGTAAQVLAEIERLVGAAAGTVLAADTTVAAVQLVVAEADETVDSARGTVARADTAIDAVGDVTDRAGARIDAVGDVTDRAGARIDAVGEVTAKADGAISSVRDVTGRADEVLSRADGLVGGTEGLLHQLQPLLDALADLPADALQHAVVVAARVLDALPDELLDRLPDLLAAAASALDTDSTSAVARLVREAPGLLDQLDDVVLPAYQLFSDVVPEVVALRELSERFEPVVLDLAARVAGLPGMKRAKKRGLEDPDVHQAIETMHSDEEADRTRAADEPAHDHGPRGLPTGAERGR
jgi:ABC-type transporter Mla subunit MlaD